MNGQDEVAAEAPGGFKFRARGYDLIVVLVLIAVIINAVFLWFHAEETKASAQTFATITKELTSAMRDVAASQRETTCVLVYDQKDRPSLWEGKDSVCKRIGRSP